MKKKLKKITVSAIILVYHDEKYLNNCISSLRQSAKIANIYLEIIIVVNDIELKSNFRFPDNCKIIFNKNNLGFAKSINQAAKEITGEWLLIVNIDTITSKFALKELLQHSVKSDIGIIAPKIFNQNYILEHSIHNEPTLWNIFIEQSYLYKLFPSIFHSYQTDVTLFSYPYEVDFVSGVFFLIRKDIYLKLNGFDEQFFIYFEDFDLCKRVKKLGYKTFFEPKAKVIHFLHQSSGGVKMGKLFVESLFLYLNKWNYKYLSKLAIYMIIKSTSFIKLIFLSSIKLILRNKNQIKKINNKMDFNAAILKAKVKLVLL